MADQFARYRHAIAGHRIETERGNPPSGFYKQLTSKPAPQHIEAICVYRDEDGALQCIRNVYGDGSRMDADQIEDLVATCCFYPIPEDVYRAVTERGEPWPEGYETRLTSKDQQAGVVWTAEYGRKKTGTDLQQAENPRAVMGGNNPPEDMTPDRAIADKVSKTAASVKAWLTEIGGSPRNKAEADKMADYATLFGEMGKDAEKQRVAEKEPHLKAGREIDSKWKVATSAAEAARKAALSHVDKWLADENRRREAEALLANEAAAKTGDQNDAPVAQAERINSVGNMRTVASRARDVWSVTDVRAYLTHLLAQDGELPAEIVEAAGKVAQRRAEAAPGITKDTTRKAA